MKFAAPFIFALALRSIALAAPASQPATAPGDFEVHEWLILLCDPYQPRANLEPMFATSLPEFVNSRRKSAPATQSSLPRPVGVIRIIGSSDAKIDVKLQLVGGGKLLAAWPEPQSRSSSILWRDLSLSRDGSQLSRITDDANWMNALRADDSSAIVSAEKQRERFLLYDAEHAYTLPLKLAGARTENDPVLAANVGSASLHDLSFYRPQKNGWSEGFLAELPVGKKTTPASKPTTSPTTAPRIPSDVEMLGVEPADVKKISLAPAPSTQPAEFLADWKDRLSREGVSASDCDLIVRIVAANALDAKQLTAVYRLDNAELDRILPLEVIPQPKKITRVALVIAKNIDPAVPQQIDDLIAQLGDRDWHKRESAGKALAALGQAAKLKLQSATKNNDPEIALRAERLLAGMGK